MPSPSAAESGAVGADSPAVDAELRVVIEAWAGLPEAAKRSIMAMVSAAAETNCDDGEDGR